MTPRDIITKHVGAVKDIRIPLVKIIVQCILDELNENGFEIVDTTKHEIVDRRKK